MNRLLFNSAAFFSLLLCLAMIVVWAGSKSRVDLLTLDTPYHVTSLFSTDGRIYFLQMTWHFVADEDANQPGPASYDWHLHYDRDDDAYNTTGWAASSEGKPTGVFGWESFGVLTNGHPPNYNQESPSGCDGWRLEIPDWAVVCGLLTLPTIALRRIRNRRWMVRIGHCACCGYDLRATPNQCPECGSKPISSFSHSNLSNAAINP